LHGAATGTDDQPTARSELAKGHVKARSLQISTKDDWISSTEVNDVVATENAVDRLCAVGVEIDTLQMREPTR
jgi:hypothetical protein